MVMQHVRVHHDAGFGGNVVAAQGDIFICHARDRWLWWMQAQSLLACLFKVGKLSEVFVFHSAPAAKNFINFSHNPKNSQQQSQVFNAEFPAAWLSVLIYILCLWFATSIVI